MSNISPVKMDVKVKSVEDIVKKVVTKSQEIKSSLNDKGIDVETLDLGDPQISKQVKGAYNDYLKEEKEKQVEAMRLKAIQLKYTEYKQAVKDGMSLKNLDEKYGEIMAKFGDYNWEKQYQHFENLENAVVSPSQEIDVAKFNENIKKNVKAAGYGTREGVVAAGKSMIVDYGNKTGHRLRYNMDLRQEPGSDGIKNDDFYLDCSSFAWGALYNGGFKIPDSGNATPGQISWAEHTGALAPIKGGKPGDFLIYDQGGGANGHIQMIADTYDNGYYLLEFQGDKGGTVSKINYDNIPSIYSRIDMTNYYNNTDNVRK